MNAIELLKKDHRTVESLFESYEKAKEKEQETSKAELFASIKEELDAHAQVEEEIFYPAFDRAAEKDDDKELVLEAGEEHKQVKTLLAELEGLDPDDETFDAKMKVLKDNIEHHVKEEEGEMFPHARKQLGDEQLEQLGQRIAARKEEIQQQSGRAGAKAPAGRPAPASRTRATSPTRRSGRASNPSNPTRGATVRASDGSGSEQLESMGMESKSSGASRSRGGSSRSKTASRSTGTSRSRGGSSRASGGRGRSSGSSSRSRSKSSRGRSTSSRGSSTSRRTSSSGRGGRARSRSRSART